MENKKVALITLEFPPDKGGVARMYGQFKAALKDKLDVYVQIPSGIERNNEAIYCKLLDNRLRVKWWPTIKQLKKIWTTNQYHKLIIGQILPLGTAALVLNVIYGCKYDVVIHGMDISMPNKISRKRLLIKLIIKRADIVIAANKFVADLLQGITNVHSDKIKVIYPYPGINDGRTNHLVEHLIESYKLDGVPILLSVGRLVERKGIQHVLEALEIVWEKYPQTNYVIIGNGPFEIDIRKKIEICSKPHQVHLLTNQTDNEIAAWYKASSIFVMTPFTMPNGDYEGFGIVNLEAANFEKPVVATRHGGVTEAVIDNETGLLVNENNINELGRAILKLLDDPDLCKRLGVNGRNRVQKEFSASSMKNKLDMLYAS